jgi:type II secretory pathway pseudopilin PulG
MQSLGRRSAGEPEIRRRLPGLRSTRGRASGGAGFSIIELLIAATIMIAAIAGLALVFGSSLTETAVARQRTAADKLLDLGMEQLRALPYGTVAKGLDDAEVAASGDPNITVSGSTFTYVPTGETIPHGNQNYPTYQQAPLIPHRSTSTVNGITYTLSTYVTNYAPGGSPVAGAYRVIASVSWPKSARPGLSSTVSSQSILYAPQGCLSNGTHPFGAPCQPFLYSTASTGLGGVTIVPSATFSDGVQGLNLSKAQLQLPEEDSAMQIEQVSAVAGKVAAGGGSIETSSGVQRTGFQAATGSADNDPGSVAATSASGSASQGATSIQASSGGGPNANLLTVTSNATAGSGSMTATAAAAASPAFSDLSGSPLLTALPCGSSDVQHNGTSSATMDLYDGNNPLGTAPLATFGTPAGHTRINTSRFIAAGTSYCTTSTGDGCVHAGASRSLGTMRLAGIPAGLAKPAGWDANNFLVEVSSYADAANAESGIGAAAPTAARQGTPTIKYWNGSGYTTRTGASWPAAGALPVTTVSYSTSGYTVTITPHLTVTAPTTAQNTPAGCTSLCSGTAKVDSPIKGDIDYTITKGGGQVMADLVISLDLGTILADTSYRAAPSAG